MALFTVESAREAGLKSAALRKQREIERASLPPEPVEPTPAEPEADDTFQLKRLARVRTQQTNLDAIMESELAKGAKADAKRLDQLAAASSRLEEVERRLSCRSLPPTVSRRIEPIKPGRRGGGASLDDVPASQVEPAAPTAPPSDQPAPPTV